MPNRLRKFAAELKRRRVFRVLWIYVVVAWVVIQVTATIAPALKLPNWIVTAVVIVALIGLPIAGLLGWAFDLTEEGVERTEEGEDITVYRARWLKPLLVMLVFVLIVGGGLLWWLRARRGVEGESAIPIAVMPFAVQGSPSLLYLRDGMVDLLSAKLDGVASLRSVEPAAVLAAVADKIGRELTVTEAEQAARTFNARYYILGSVVEQEGQVVVGAALYEVGKSEPIEQASARESRESILPLVDEIAAELLIEQFKGPASRMIRAAGLTTNSFAALRAYLEGETAYRGSQFQAATDWFNRALQEDSTFALAAYRVATAGGWSGRFDVAKNGIAVAVANRERLSVRDQNLVSAFSAYLHGRADEAEQMYREAVRTHPEDYEAWYWLGETLFHYNKFRGRTRREAKPYFESALRIASDETVLKTHLLDIALEEGDYKTFDRLIPGLDPENAWVQSRIMVRRFATRDQQEIDAALEDLKDAIDGTIFDTSVSLAEFLYDVDNAEKVANYLIGPTRNYVQEGVGRFLLAELDVARGRWNSAKQRLEPYRKTYHVPERAYLPLYAAMPLLDVPEAELRNLRGNLEQWDAAATKPLPMPPSYLGAHNGIHVYLRYYLIGLMSARLNDARSVESNMRLLLQTPDTTPQPGLPARLAKGLQLEHAVLTNRRTALIDSIANVTINADLEYVINSPFYALAHERLVVADALLRDKRYREALGWYSSLVDSRAELYLLGASLLGRARSEEELGRKQAAIRHYQAFVRMWEKCDPHLRPVLRNAQQRLAKLRDQ